MVLSTDPALEDDGDAARIFVTLGTAWAFEHNGRVVANCHRLPARAFARRYSSTA